MSVDWSKPVQVRVSNEMYTGWVAAEVLRTLPGKFAVVLWDDAGKWRARELSAMDPSVRNVPEEVTRMVYLFDPKDIQSPDYGVDVLNTSGKAIARVLVTFRLGEFA